MTAVAPAIARPGSTARRLARAAPAIGVSVIALVVIAAALEFVRDPDGPEKFLVSFYGAIGAGGQADAIRSFGLNPVMAKLMVAGVALVVGIAGVWALLRGRERPRRCPRIGR